MPKSSSRRWLREHFSDSYVKQAQKAGYRSRSVYKLLELQERDKLFKPGMKVIDLGSAPGGWCQVVTQYVGSSGQVFALDLLPMEPVAGVEFIQGDFSEALIAEKLSELVSAKVDWVISDIAPNLSGIESVDQARSIYLCELVLDFAIKTLAANGGLLIKVFQGEGFDEFLKQVRQHFKKVVIRKPKASRGRSKEVYILAKN